MQGVMQRGMHGATVALVLEEAARRLGRPVWAHEIVALDYTVVGLHAEIRLREPVPPEETQAAREAVGEIALRLPGYPVEAGAVLFAGEAADWRLEVFARGETTRLPEDRDRRRFEIEPEA